MANCGTSYSVHGALGLSGEPIAPQVAPLYGTEPKNQANATKIAATNIARREYQKEYMEYWNSTVDFTGTGRPVDGIITPVAPFAAARPDSYSYYGYSTIFNTLDYSSCVIPVTNVDRNIDIISKDFKPLNEQDQSIAEICKSWSLWKLLSIINGAIQMIQKYTMVLTCLCNWSDEDYRRRRSLLWPSMLAISLPRPDESQQRAWLADIYSSSW